MNRLQRYPGLPIITSRHKCDCATLNVRLWEVSTRYKTVKEPTDPRLSFRWTQTCKVVGRTKVRPKSLQIYEFEGSPLVDVTSLLCLVLFVFIVISRLPLVELKHSFTWLLSTLNPLQSSETWQPTYHWQQIFKSTIYALFKVDKKWGASSVKHRGFRYRSEPLKSRWMKEPWTWIPLISWAVHLICYCTFRLKAFLHCCRPPKRCH